MRKLRSILVVVAGLALCLSFAVPAEDLPETPYDESEAPPYESAPLFSIILQDSAGGLQSVLISALMPRVNPLARRDGILAKRSARTPHPICRSVTILDHSLRC
jgi:hypothetical protein